MANSKQEIDDLFTRYLAVCNQALQENKDAFPYKLMWDAAERIMDDHSVRLAVYDDQPKECYSLTMKNKQINATEDHDPSHAKDAWRVNLSYLQQVVDHPQEYIKHPAKLDWDWLRNRMGI